ncbi:MAG TPA: hypothetical protein VI796_06115, partial [Candidatus Thermoplasmatota archaeon]|nr:hypothetical protein [Candidatus Thermoplasmatota archaeon]
GSTSYEFTDAAFPVGEEHTYRVEAVLDGNTLASFAAEASTSSEPVRFAACDLRVLDSDRDGVCDAHEEQLGTNVQAQDSDDDGVPDGEEIEAGRDPGRAELQGIEDATAAVSTSWVPWVLGVAGAAVALLAALAVVVLRRR